MSASDLLLQDILLYAWSVGLILPVAASLLIVTWAAGTFFTRLGPVTTLFLALWTVGCFIAWAGGYI